MSARAAATVTTRDCDGLGRCFGLQPKLQPCGQARSRHPNVSALIFPATKDKPRYRTQPAATALREDDVRGREVRAGVLARRVGTWLNIRSTPLMGTGGGADPRIGGRVRERALDPQGRASGRRREPATAPRGLVSSPPRQRQPSCLGHVLRGEGRTAAGRSVSGRARARRRAPARG